VDGGRGIFYPRGAKVLTFLPGTPDPEAIGSRNISDELVRPAYLLIPHLEELDIGELRAEQGHYARIWSRKLAEAFAFDRGGLVRRLRNEGVALRHLRHRIKEWCSPPSTVIHAPQQVRHFEILIRVLGIDFENAREAAKAKAPWWRYAWREIAISRGEAIQSGMQEHEIGETELLAQLRSRVADVRQSASGAHEFRVQLPLAGAIRGYVAFYEIDSAEVGYSVPDQYMRQLLPLAGVEQWRN
jgi:hypothetical protein